MCPKSINDLKTAQRNVKKVGGKKIEFGPIVQAIVESKMYFSVAEVHENPKLVNNKVTRFRTMKLLNKAVDEGKLTRLLDNNTFYYGVPETPASKSA